MYTCMYVCMTAVISATWQITMIERSTVLGIAKMLKSVCALPVSPFLHLPDGTSGGAGASISPRRKSR